MYNSNQYSGAEIAGCRWLLADCLWLVFLLRFYLSLENLIIKNIQVGVENKIFSPRLFFVDAERQNRFPFVFLEKEKF
ncbi:hypothetical protein ASG21_12005 [Chryseobacterium sp. Leaf394]|nr:hypothetical protein ASG21_12005 [Chryseobacterium sp. Leaf394]